jgi:AraC-like DNA-binding protein
MNAFLYASASLASVLAVYLATGSGLPKTTRHLLSAAMLILASLNLLTLLALGDPGSPLLVLRPALAVALSALLYLHFATATRTSQKLQPGDAIHMIGPLAATAVRLLPNPGQWLDLVIALPNLCYLGLIGWDARRGTTSFENLGPAVAALLDQWRRLVLVFLVFVMSFDILIMLEIGVDSDAAPQPLMFEAAGMLLTLGFTYLLVSSLHRKGPLMWASSRQRDHNPEHEALIAQLEDQLLASSAFLDPNLTLQRFARKVGVPPREVSAAINDHRHCNYNQWLNNFRIKEAQRLMREYPAKSVTEVMFASGFQNKSTFNAAFLAASGESPTAWRSRFSDHAT